jgi:hypothetical protein
VGVMLARRDVLNPCWGSRDRIADILVANEKWSDRRVFRSISGFGVYEIKFEEEGWSSVCVSMRYVCSRTTS